MSELRAQSVAGSRREPGPAASRRRMAALVRRARRAVVGPDAIPSHSAAMVRLFAEINRSAAPMLGLVALGTLRSSPCLDRRGRARHLVGLHRLRDRAYLRTADRFSRGRRQRECRRRMAAQVRPRDRLLRRRLGLSRPRPASVARAERAGFRHAGHAAGVDGDVAAGGGHSGRVRGRHAADDRRRRRTLRVSPSGKHAACGGDRGRGHRLFSCRRPAPARSGEAQHLVSGGEGFAHRRARTGQAQFGRGAPPGRKRQSGQVPVSRHDEPRAAHAPQRDPWLFGGDEGGAVRSRTACRPTRNIRTTSM